MISQEFRHRSGSLFNDLRKGNADNVRRTICYLNFYIPLFLHEFQRREEDKKHTVLISWRYSTFLPAIVQKKLSSGKRLNEVPDGAVIPVKLSSSSILQAGLRLALEKEKDGELVFIIVPASLVLIEKLKAMNDAIPGNLILIIDGCDAFLRYRQNIASWWNVSTFHGGDMAFFSNAVAEARKKANQVPQLIVVEQEWEQILI